MEKLDILYEQYRQIERDIHTKLGLINDGMKKLGLKLVM